MVKFSYNETSRHSMQRSIALALSAILGAALAVLLTGANPVWAAGAIIDVNPTDGNFVPITQVVLDDNGTIVTQTVESTPENRINRSTPVNLISVTVDDGGEQIVLDQFNLSGGTVELIGLDNPAYDPGDIANGGLGVLQSNGTRVLLRDGREAFRQALEETLTNTNLNNYVHYDGIVNPPADIPDYDIMFPTPRSEEGYVLVMERWGNTFFTLTPLDAAGAPITEANVLRFGFPTGTAYTLYDWNTGYANATYQSVQAYAFTVAKTSKFFEGTTVPANERYVYGFRIDNDGEADVKFFGLGISEIDIQKTPDLQTVPVGTDVQFSITVTNTGDVELNDVIVTDVLAPDCDANLGTLQPGESETYTCTLEDVGNSFTNVAIVEGTPVSGPKVFADDDAKVEVIINPNPAIDIRKNAEGEDSQTVVTGDTVTWTIRVQNTGNVTLTNVTISDPLAPDCADSIGTLTPGQVVSYTCVQSSVVASFVNVATVTGTPPTGANVTDEDPSTVQVINPDIIIEKATNGEDADTGPGPLVSIGSIVTWTYVVTNTSDVVLTGILVTDSVEGPISCSVTSLNPGASMTCTQTGTAQAGQYANLAVVTGSDPTGRVVDDEDPSHYFGTIAALGDRVWLDANRNGLQDDGEQGVPGMVVTLFSDVADAAIISTTTDINGNYLFDNLAPGAYYVLFDQPEGFTFTERDVNGNSQDTIDSDAQVPALTLTVMTPATEIGLGDRLSYTLNYGNADTQLAAVTVVLSTTVPTGTTFLPAASTPGWVCAGNQTDAGTICTLTVAQLAANTQDQAQFVVQLGTDDAQVPEIIDLTVNITQTTLGRTPPVTLADGDQNLTLDAGIHLADELTEIKTPRRPGPTNLEEGAQPHNTGKLYIPSIQR